MSNPPNTLDSIRKRQDEDESSDEDEEKRQAFYAGGSQSSGQQVLGPPKKRDELVAEMFKKARELGAEDVNSGEPSSSKKKSNAAFGGAGYKLGEKSSETERVPPSAETSVQKPKQSREIVLRLWSTGFTVDDGPLRSFVDPANMEFLSSVKHGEIPRELIRDNQGREVELTMEDRRHEEYVAPNPSTRPFGGVGQMLGSPSPAVVGGTANLSESDRQANENAARTLIPLIESEPTTNVSFRLVDGTRLVARFNHSHTVNDLHTFINTARPQFSTLNYVLTIFPNIELTEKDVTVKDANLLNAALIQKIK
jgi:UBX domain-containing protein 1